MMRPVLRNAYDAENRLISATPATSASLTNGAIRVLNAYDHKHRRIRKTVQHLTVTMPPAPSPPSETYEWNTVETHTFVWDGDDIVLERIAFTNGTSRVCEYFWGPDMSGAEQGAGGVGGLLAVSMDGVFYIPCYDHNGNIVWYVSEFGAVAAEYVYDPYGNVVETTGALAEQFSFGFSTKPLDHETGLVAYQRRFLRPAIGRWLNRDPIEEEGGENLYAFCINAPTILFDVEGMWFRELSNFCAGVGDSLTFGITRLLRHGINRIIEGTWDDPADVDSNAYLAGEITEVTVEIAVTVGGATLRHTAKATSRAAVEAGARKTYRRHHKIVGGFVHHINPIKGHMNGKPARFPLPYEWAARGEWNMTWYATKAEHTAAHKSMMMLEAVDRFRTVTLGARQGANIIMTQLNSSEDTRCWDSIDVSIGVSQEDIGGSVLNTVPDTIAIQFQESGRSW